MQSKKFRALISVAFYLAGRWLLDHFGYDVFVHLLEAIGIREADLVVSVSSNIITIAIAVALYCSLAYLPARGFSKKHKQGTFIPFANAADELYRAVKDRRFGKLTHDRSVSNLEIRDAMGRVLLGNGQELWGRRVGAAEPEPLSRRDQVYNNVAGGAILLQDRGGNVTWRDIKISRGELDRIKTITLRDSDSWN